MITTNTIPQVDSGFKAEWRDLKKFRHFLHTRYPSHLKASKKASHYPFIEIALAQKSEAFSEPYLKTLLEIGNAVTYHEVFGNAPDMLYNTLSNWARSEIVEQVRILEV